MNLAEHIQKELDLIVEEWEAFARTSIPPARYLTVEELRDHARVLLQAVVADMQTEQAPQAQQEKSRGELPGNSPRVTETAQSHAQHRFSQGFTQNQLVSEYRALRASVLRRWMAELETADRIALEAAVRFGETMDQGVTESIKWYVGKVEHSRSLLLGVLGHDMRTPLGAARMSAQYLLQTEALDKDQTKAALRIVNSTGRMRAMIDDLLDFTQTVLGLKLSVLRAPLDLGDICSELVAEVAALHPRCAIVLERTGDLIGTWDSGRISQLVTNLVSNAVQHGEEGRPVTVGVLGDASSVRICVHNFGGIISHDARATLFDPLKQTSPSSADRHRGSSGLGLGLYIAKEIATAHGGSLDVESNEQDGTSFTAKLPRTPPIPRERRAELPQTE